MRVVCWNIERGYQPNAIIEQLQTLKGDVYLLFELDRGVKRTRGVDMYGRIKNSLGLHAAYAREFYEIDSPWRSIIPWGGPGGGEIGNAVFSRYPILNHRIISLPTAPPLNYRRTTLIPELFQPRAGQRKAQVFEIAPYGTKIGLASMHLELWRSGWSHRKSQLQAALNECKAETLIFGGDFNCVGGGEVKKVRQWLQDNNLVDPFKNSDTTCGRLGVRAKLDWLATTQPKMIKAARTCRTALSDHSYLVVDFNDSYLGAPGSRIDTSTGTETREHPAG